MTERPLRIVHIVPRDGLGGVETAARSMAARDDLPCDFHLLFLAGETLAPDNIRIEARGSGSTANPGNAGTLLARCRQLRPDVVVGSLWRSVPLLIALRVILPRAKLVMTLNSGRAAHAIDDRLFRTAARVVDEVWSDSETALIAREVRAKSRVISFVIDRSVPVAPAVPASRFVAWARIDRNKGFDVALGLIAALAGRGLNPHFDLHGPDGGAVDALKRQAVALGIGERVHFHGPIVHAELHRAAEAASFFLLPSLFEGMSMACVEAMQFGLVPVVTPVGEMAHYVIPGETGLIIDTNRLKDTVDGIAALLADTDRYAAIQHAAIERWRAAPLYADQFCAAARALAGSTARTTTSLA